MSDISTVVLPDRIDSETSGSVETLIMKALKPGGRVIIDGEQVAYMSAAGVRAFARALHHAEAVGARIAFCRFTGPAADCLLVSGFTALFDVLETVEAAAQRLKSSSPGTSDERLRRRGHAG